MPIRRKDDQACHSDHRYKSTRHDCNSEFMSSRKLEKSEKRAYARLALSKEDEQGVELVKSWMEEAGMEASIDPFANLIGRIEGSDPSAPVLMLGSHVDSQPYGGRFDGAIGVLGAIEAVQTLVEEGITPRLQY